MSPARRRRTLSSRSKVERARPHMAGSGLRLLDAKGRELVAVGIAEIAEIIAQLARPAIARRPFVGAAQLERPGVEAVDLLDLVEHQGDHVAIAAAGGPLV